MTPNQEKKFDDLYLLVLTMAGDMRVYNEKQDNQRDAIIKLAKDVVELETKADAVIADKNKLIGVAWVGSITSILISLGLAMLSLFKVH